MTVALLADAHIGGPGGPAEPLVRQLEEVAAAGCARLVVLGDLFQVWVALQRYETDEVRCVLDALGRIAAAGVALDYVEGNRDFFVAGSEYASLFDRVGSEVTFHAGGRRYLAVHGDGIDPTDRQYRFWRWLSKSLPSRFLMKRLPTGLARRCVHGTERGLARTNFEHKARIPEAAILAYASERLREGHDALLLGHFHEERRWEVPEGEVWLLDAWFRSRRIERLAS
jgi:UDP-2,3-diacylglucosamine hydrolase